MKRLLCAASSLVAAAAPASADTGRPIEFLLDNGYEIVAITDAGQPRIDLVYLKKGRSHVVCKYVPFAPDWSPLGESTCVPINYATE